MNPIETIESNCRDLAGLRGKLRKKFEARQKAVNAVAAEYDSDIREMQSQCTLCRSILLANLQTGRELFTKRKTQEFHGITVGFEKQRDSLVLPANELLVDRIEKMLPPAQSKTLLDRTVTVIKNAFKKLPIETLQKLGVTIMKGADNPIVRANDDDIETLVSKSLGDSVQDTATGSANIPVAASRQSAAN